MRTLSRIIGPQMLAIHSKGRKRFIHLRYLLRFPARKAVVAFPSRQVYYGLALRANNAMASVYALQ